MRTVAQFEGALWREAGGGAPGHSGEERPSHGGRGGPDDPIGGPDGPSELILPPDFPVPDPPPEPGPDAVDPGLCEHIGELCIALYEEAAAALLSDPHVDLLASVDPNCVCHDYDPNQEFVGRPAQGRRLPVPLPDDVKLIFRSTDITSNIIQPVTPQELRFTIPPSAHTGSVYLRGLFPAERAGVQHPERLCGMDMPDFPSVPVNGPAALIGIIFPPVIDSLTADGEPGPVVVTEKCHAAEVCWHAHLSDQAPDLPNPPCGRIGVTVRGDAGQVLEEGGAEGCLSIIGEDDQTLTVQARSYADSHECGHASLTSITLERIARVTLTRDVPLEEEVIVGTDGSLFVEISCPAPPGGMQVRLRSSAPTALQVPRNVVIPQTQRRVQVDFTTTAGWPGRVQVHAAAAGHEEGRLDYDLVRSPAEICRSLEDATQPWTRDNQSWANWGVTDQAETFLGFLPTPRLFRPTTAHEIAQAIQQAEPPEEAQETEREIKTIRALGSGWSFSEVALPQKAAIQGLEQAVAAPLRVAALLGYANDEMVHGLATTFRSHFGYAIDTSGLDRNLQFMLSDLLDDSVDPAGFFFVEAGMTLNFLNTLLDSQTSRVALKTMGGASAQSIAGAISTGTHGGDFDRPPLADAVCAIYLVGKGGTHHWIEPADHITDPAKLRAAFPCLADNIHYDDDMFRAVLVSMGAMGVIYAVILNVVPQYSLLQWNKWSTWEQLMEEQRASGFAGLFNGSWTGMTGFLAQNGFGDPPNRFVQVVINPIRTDEGKHTCYVTNRVQLPLREADGVQPVTEFRFLEDKIRTTIIHTLLLRQNFQAVTDFTLAFLHHEFNRGTDFEKLQTLVRLCKDGGYPWLLQAIIDVVMKNSFPEAGAEGPQIDTGFKVMAPSSTTRTFPPLGGTSIEPAFSFFPTVPALDQPGVQVAVPDVITFIDAVLAAFDRGVDNGAMFPAGYMSLRVTGRTAALLGMQRFDRNGFVEVSLIGRPDGYALVQLVEQIARHQGGALHWGQSNGMMDFLDLEAHYGNPNINKWMAVQRRLGGETFTNNFMRRCGLA
jgi:FAD/FMN-containing dehydrogenase